MNVFVIVLLVGAGLIPLKTSFTPQPSDDQNLIALKTRTIDVRQAAFFSLGDEDSLSRRFIVHFNHRITNQDRQVLETKGFIIESYLPQGGFLVYGPVLKAQELFSNGLIDWYGEYLPKDKIDPALLDKTERTKLEIMLFPGEDLASVEYELEKMGAEIAAASDDEQWNGKLIVWLNPVNFTAAAGIEGVRWIEPWYEVELFNDQAQWVTQTWKRNNRRIWDEGLHGENVLGSICDSGVSTDHVMFADSTIDITSWGDYPEHRKIVAYQPSTSSVNFGDQGGYISYHGTHTSCTVCGDDSYWQETSSYDGMAPKSRIYFLDFDGYGYGITADYRTMYLKPYTGNAAGKPKFMSNSWGEGTGYNSHAWESDQFMWEHPEFLLIFAAGNSYTTLNAPGTAKNMVTVGAVGDGESATVPADFSSAGPAPDGRVKPDVMAPGVNLYSANGATTDGYQQMSGTSMACPAVAGATALLIQYLREGWYPTGSPGSFHDAMEPSAALLKAMLIVSTDADFPERSIPHSKIGWGRIDLDSVLYFAGDTRKLYLYDDTTGIQTGEQVSFEIKINASTTPLRIALVWTDPPPELSATKQLINNLDLEVYTPSEQLYPGNNFKDNYSERNGDPDDINVVEMVRIKEPVSGTWSVRIKGTEIPEGPQPYALVITGDLDYHDVNLTARGMGIDDADASNPNGGLDPGETAMVYPAVKNEGTYDASTATGTLSTEEPSVEILTETTNYGSITAGSTSSGQGFSVKASSDIPMDKEITFILEIEANNGAYVRTLEYPTTIGLGIGEIPTETGLSLEVMQSPFTDHIGVRFVLTEAGPVRLEMFDNTGRKVRTLLDEAVHPSGSRYYTFTAADDLGRSLPNGVYFVKLITKDRQLVCKGLQLK